jgi:hypothetical protein
MNDLVEPAVQQINSLRGAMQSRIDDGEMIEIDPPLDHYFTEGLYGRRIYCPAGITIVTKVHMSHHISVALRGTCTVFSDKGEKSEITAPGVWVTEPGTVRAIYCHDEVEWLTVHTTDKKTVDEVEFDIFADTFDEYLSRVKLLENKP